jgi:Rrf2 family protein
MRLELTRRADLAARTLVLLDGADRLKAGALAERLGTTTGFVPQIVGPLVRAGWVRSEPGPTGGYALDVDLAAVSVLEVIEAAEGPTDSGRCVVVDRPCDRENACLVHDAWADARHHLVSTLAATSLRDLARTEARR